jgi:hypothetical protein
MNLPPIIQELPAVAATVHYEAKLELPVRKFVLCITRDLSEQDLALFKDYRLVEYEDSIHRNISILSFQWDVLVFDLREKSDRYAYLKEVAPRKEQFNVIVYCHGFEKDDVDIAADNVLTSFPERQARREDWEMLVMSQRIKKPRWWVSLFSCILTYYHKAKN